MASYKALLEEEDRALLPELNIALTDDDEERRRRRRPPRRLQGRTNSPRWLGLLS